MKEATGEVSMTVVTLVAIAVIAGILAFMWKPIKAKISNLWGDDAQKCEAGKSWDGQACVDWQ